MEEQYGYSTGWVWTCAGGDCSDGQCCNDQTLKFLPKGTKCGVPIIAEETKCEKVNEEEELPSQLWRRYANQACTGGNAECIVEEDILYWNNWYLEEECPDVTGADNGVPFTAKGSCFDDGGSAECVASYDECKEGPCCSKAYRKLQPEGWPCDFDEPKYKSTCSLDGLSVLKQGFNQVCSGNPNDVDPDTGYAGCTGEFVNAVEEPWLAFTCKSMPDGTPLACVEEENGWGASCEPVDCLAGFCCNVPGSFYYLQDLPPFSFKPKQTKCKYADDFSDWVEGWVFMCYGHPFHATAYAGCTGTDGTTCSFDLEHVFWHDEWKETAVCLPFLQNCVLKASFKEFEEGVDEVGDDWYECEWIP